jgi:hypothetical protein
MTGYNKDVLEITLIVVLFSMSRIPRIDAVTNMAISELASRRSISVLNVG